MIPVYVLFFLSGATGLVYEVLWAKQLVLVLGNTALAHSLILSVFLGGLALGNWALGRRSDIADQPLRFYGLLELGISVLGFLSPVLLGMASRLYIALARQGISGSVSIGLKTFLCALILLLPAVLMGGTLPTLSRFAVRSRGKTTSAVAWFYFLNSAGASVGAILAGFWLIPTFGLNLPIFGAALTDVLIGMCALALSRYSTIHVASKTTIDGREEKVHSLDARRRRILYGAAFLSGFAALCYEIAWIRYFSLILGSSAYSFSLVLSAFIAGISLGGLFAARFASRGMNAYLSFGLAHAGVALSLLLTFPIYERGPFFMYWVGSMLHRTNAAFYLYQAYQLALCFLLILLPSSSMGMALPFAGFAAASKSTSVGRQVGTVFGLNAFGNFFGAFSAGLCLLPLLGIQRLLEAAVLLNLLVACGALATSALTAKRRTAVLCALAFLLIVAYPVWRSPWDKLVLSAGEFRGRPVYEPLSYAGYRQKIKAQSLLYYKDDSEATITVLKENGDTFLKTNGKTDASAITDINTEILTAEIPLLLKPRTQEVLVVGLGSGITAGSVLSHPIRRLDMVELSAAVVEASRFFSDLNGRPLEDPRLSLHVDDAKAFLARTQQRYDMILSEPSNPWIAGVASLFSVDFYRDAKAHLNPDGVMAQWFHLYEMNDETLRLILRTFCSQFDRVLAWEIPPSRSDILLIGSRRPISPIWKETEESLRLPAVARDLSRIGISHLPSVLYLQMASNPTIRRLAGAGRVNEDQFPILEYEAPKAFFIRDVSALLYAGDERLGHGSSEPTLLARYLQARGRPLDATELNDLAEFFGRSNDIMLGPVLYEWTHRYPEDSRPALALAQLKANQGDLEGALAHIENLLRKDPDHADYLDLAAKLELQLFIERRSHFAGSMPKQALKYLERLSGVTDGVRKAQAYTRIAEIYANTGSLEIAERYIDRAAALAGRNGQRASPDNIYAEGARMAMDRGNGSLAAEYLRKALKINPDNEAAKHLTQKLTSASAN